MSIAERIDQAMKAAKIPSQNELSRRSGVPQPTIARILKGGGKKGPETGTLVALARALNVELSWLQMGMGDPAQHAKGHAISEVLAAAVMQRHWLAPDEAELLNQYRSSTSRGKQLIRLAAERARKDVVDSIMDES